MKHPDQETHIYVAGPMYGSGHVDENIKAALVIADILADSVTVGAIPFVPHLFTFWHFRSEKPVEDWLRMDKAWLRKCDGMVRIKGESPGATLEEEWAADWEVPVLHLPSVKTIMSVDSEAAYWHKDIGVKIQDWVARGLPK